VSEQPEEQGEDIQAELTRAELLRRSVLLAAGAGFLGVTPEALAESSARPKPKRGGIARGAISDITTKETLDPANINIYNERILNATLFESLTALDDKWVAHPSLATRWESNARATEWTFHIRPGVKFHDGTPLTAHDAVYTLQRLLDKKLGSPIYSRLSQTMDPQGIKAVNDHTLVVKLKHPDSLLPAAIGARYAHIVKRGTRVFNVRTAIGTGPFKIKSFAPGQSWKVARNPNYWQPGLPYLDGIEVVAVPEQTTKVQSVLSGRSDFADPIDFSAAAAVTNNRSSKLLVQKDAIHLVIDMDQTVPPFTDERVRLAIKLAVDRRFVVKNVYHGYATVTGDVPVPATDPFYPRDIGLRPRNLARAKALLAQAGYPNGLDLEIFTSQALGGMVDLAVVFAQLVKDAGVRVKITQWPPATYWDQVWLVKPMYTSYWIRRHPNDILSIAYASNSSINECKFHSPKMDALLSAGLAARNPKKQNQIYKEALRLVANGSGASIPAFVHALWPTKARLKGTKFDLQNGLLFNRAFLA
jgi:peptide/nickel transport system substrate-binding protein